METPGHTVLGKRISTRGKWSEPPSGFTQWHCDAFTLALTRSASKTLQKLGKTHKKLMQGPEFCNRG